MSKTLHTQTDGDNVLIVRFDHADKSINTFSPLALDELDAVIAALERGEQEPVGVIFTSDKPDVFISGADLFEMSRMDRPQMQQFLEHGQSLFDRIAKLPMPTVAAINGHCLGGGLELSLACTWRVAADKGSINLGLPEIMLGIIPAWGGTTRVTRMLGLTRALPLLLTGKTMPPRKAQRVGLIDEVVRPEALLAAARRLLKRTPPVHRPPLVDRVIMATGPLCDLVGRKARRQTLARTFGNYPAAEKLIDTALIAARHGHDAALRAERDAVMQLVNTDACTNLMRLFFLRQNAKRTIRQTLDAEPAEVNHVAVIGGGIMGAGIVHSLIRCGVRVRLIDIDEKAISASLRRIKRMIDGDVKAKRISPLQAQQAIHRVSPTTDWSGLKLIDLVIEAVTEKMDVKHQVFEKLDRLTKPDAVLASNTSSLNITELAETTANPGRVIGLHFFNPVPKMPLVEVVRTKHSDAAALATGTALAMRMGKTPIIVADAPGFVINRVLIPYLAEALVMASEGVSIVEIDRAMKKWGMPMGPFELLDQVGLDVAVYILQSLRSALGQTIVIPHGIEQVVERGWLGRKSGRGFYDYKRKGRPRVNTDLINLLSNQKPKVRSAKSAIGNQKSDEQDIQWRLVLLMVNEAARLLTEGVTDSTDTIDLASVLGLGLAPFRGGLVHFAETAGLDEIVKHLDQMAQRHGPRFAAVEALRHAAEAHLPMQELANTSGRPAPRPTAMQSAPTHLT
ncbi:MAG: 3-hydroxyacyl-CoA dehydrogenase NAD-binding domain-containing protein [Phycisphaeraceae bacterium]